MKKRPLISYSPLLLFFWMVALFCAAGFLGRSATAESGQAFSISPPLLELKADPGQTVIAKIKLTNVSNDELSIKTQLNDFGAKNETGEPNIIFDDSENVSYSLRQWITSPPPFKIKSRETKTLELPIVVPKGAEPGGHYAVIRFSGTAPDLEESGVALSASIGSLVLLQVTGDIKQNTSILDFFSATENFAKSTFFEQGPITFAQRMQNDGNIHTKPTGTMQIVDIFGRTVETLRVNGDPNDTKNPPKSVLPGSIRRFNQSFHKDWLIGKYEARLNLTYGDNRTLNSTLTFWVVPYKIILAVIVGLVALFFVLRLLVKKYNAHIIRRSQK